MSNITKVFAREILDSRGAPTVEAVVETESGVLAVASVPSGASTGEWEACELRDNDKSRYCGKGVLKAVKNVNEIIAPKLIGKSVLNQEEIDKILISLDGTPYKSNLGANAILAVSIAVCRAGAAFLKEELFSYIGKGQSCLLPRPMFNVLNGGAHASSSIDFQEYMIVPLSAKTFKVALQMASEVFASLKKILQKQNLPTTVGDEGGFAPNLNSNEAPLKLICKAIKNAGYKPGEDVGIALDVAASEFYNSESKNYDLKKSGEGTKTTAQMIRYIEKLCTKYPIISVEDPLGERDKEGFKKITEKLGNKVQIIGDDLFVTNLNFLKEGVKQKLANGILIKPNQIGTVTETIKCVKYAQKNGFKVIISHRSGETEDTFIADLVVALKAGQIKSGSVTRGERTAKYNRLIRIEEGLLKKAKYFK